MHPGTKETRLILSATIILILICFSCKKNNSSSTPGSPITTPAIPHVDTTALLTAHKWLIHDIWNDNNNNGIEDLDSNEVLPGSVSYTVSKFNVDGSEIDSFRNNVVDTTRWEFVGNSRSTIKRTWDSNTDYFTIILITDSALTVQGTYSNQWRYVKF